MVDRLPELFKACKLAVDLLEKYIGERYYDHLRWGNVEFQDGYPETFDEILNLPNRIETLGYEIDEIFAREDN